MDSSRDPPLEFEQPCEHLPEWLRLELKERIERIRPKRCAWAEQYERIRRERRAWAEHDERMRREPSLPVPWRREQILLKYDEPFTKQMLLNFCDRYLSELKQTSRSLSKDLIPQVNVINLGTPKLEGAKSADPELQLVKCPLDYDGQQNFKLNHPPICRYPIGNFVGKSVMETILDDVSEQKLAFDSLSNDENFQKQVAEVLKYCCGREIPHKSPIGNWPCRGLRKEFPILTGSHNIVNAVVQILLAKVLGKKRIIVATRDGQHGLAVADICASVGLQCIIYMDAQDVEEQRSKMQLLHAQVRAVDPGKDSKSAAIWDWVTNIEITHYILGSNAMATGAMSYSVPDDDDEPEPYAIHAGPDCVRCRYCGSNVSRQHQEYHNQLHLQSVGAKLVLGTAAFTTKFCTLTRNLEGFTDHFSKSCTWLSSIFDEPDSIFAVPGSLGGWVYRTRLPQICEKWKNHTGNLASVSEVVSKVVHVLRGVADEAGRLANKAKMAIIPANVAAVHAAEARLGLHCNCSGRYR